MPARRPPVWHGRSAADPAGSSSTPSTGSSSAAARGQPRLSRRRRGSGPWSNVICGIDYVTGLDTDSDPTNNVDVVNMSLGDTGDVGNCQDGGLRQAICTSVAAGIVYVAAAGNSAVDASTFIPAAFPEVITVSAMTDFDGEPGGHAGCQFIIELFDSAR